MQLSLQHLLCVLLIIFIFSPSNKKVVNNTFFQDTMAYLVQSISVERQCTQLVEQHEAAQDWLREHVKSLGDPPTDRQGLQSSINTLKVR